MPSEIIDLTIRLAGFLLVGVTVWALSGRYPMHS